MTHIDYYAYVEEDGNFVLPEEVKKLSRKANIPRRFSDASLHAKYAKGELANLCREYVKAWPENSDGMILAGHSGLGKTHYACAVANELLRFWSKSLDMEIYYFNANTDLPKLLDMRYFRRYTPYQEMMTKLTEFELVIIDDLLQTMDQDWGKEILYRIYEARYANGFRTITTLNAKISRGDDGDLDWSPISDHFNEAFMRRVVEPCGSNLVLMGV